MITNKRGYFKKTPRPSSRDYGLLTPNDKATSRLRKYSAVELASSSLRQTIEESFNPNDMTVKKKKFKERKWSCR